MERTCGKCSKIILDKQLLKCKQCGLHYHLGCTSVSERRFYGTLTGEHRENWKCQSCIVLLQNNQSAQQSNDLTPSRDYVTQRSKTIINISTENSFQSLSVESDDEEDEWEDSVPGNNAELNRSCPELQNLKNYAEIEQMKKQIEDLKLKLQIAENEIDNLITENYALKNQHLKKDTKIEQLKNFCRSSPTNTPSKKRKTLNKTKLEALKKVLDIDLNFENIGTENTAEHETKNIEPTREDRNQQREKIDIETNKIRLCVLNSNSKNKILKTTEKHFPNATTCHYLTPGGGVHQILSGIESKLQDFTLNDYCVIFIGENDFQKTNNYLTTIEYIREKIMCVQHTNVIICLPTYKLGRSVNLFNKRVEVFNNLMYLDNLSHKYAFILDSNKRLEYTSRMFDLRTGFVNNIALRIIFDEIIGLINDNYNYYIDTLNTTQALQTNSPLDDKFFR